MDRIRDFIERINIEFKNVDLLRESLTHRSYINENPKWGTPHNERLEFLGDAVLELVTTDFLFAKYPKHTEGELTSIRAALVNYQILAKVAKDISLDAAIYLSKGESKDTARAKEVILANAFEAVIGAIYLDRGYDTAKKFIEKNVLIHVDEIINRKSYKDPKSLLQEIVQENHKITPSYSVISEEGPDHNKIFEVGVYIGKKFIGKGKGFSKQDAEIEAAKDALKELKKED